MTERATTVVVARNAAPGYEREAERWIEQQRTVPRISPERVLFNE